MISPPIGRYLKIRKYTMPGSAIRYSVRCFHSVAPRPRRRGVSGTLPVGEAGAGESSRGAFALVSITGSATIGHPCSASSAGGKPIYGKPVSREDPVWSGVREVSTARTPVVAPYPVADATRSHYAAGQNPR